MKAQCKDATPGAPLWIKDHGEWKLVIATKARPDDKGHQVVWTDTEGNSSESALDTMYTHPSVWWSRIGNNQAGTLAYLQP